MRKILLVLLIVGTFCSGAFAAESGDMYLRRDVFEARMDAFEAKLDAMEAKNQLRIEQILREIQKIDAKYLVLDERTNGIERSVNWLIGIWGVIIGLPLLQKFWEFLKDKTRSQSITLDDVKKLIAESKMS